MECVKILVACLIIYVLKFTEADEIKEFSEFLFKTSQLDQILKKGNDFEDDDDEQPSDHAWEESGKFEGDLILNDRQRRLLIEEVAEGLSRNGLKDSAKKWPNNVVIYYIQKEHFTDDQMQAIESGIEDIARASCVKFRPYRRGDRDAVVIQGSRRGCFSQVGYQGGYQVLNLSGRHPVGRGCFRHGTVVHELLHTLGFYHMQSSPDRDEYIDVVWENIIEPARHNFRKYNSFSVTDFGVGYDYDSVLHYSRRAFSANGRDTLVPKKGHGLASYEDVVVIHRADPMRVGGYHKSSNLLGSWISWFPQDVFFTVKPVSGASIGQRIGLSDKDTQKLNKMYCDGDSDSLNADDETISKSHQTKQNPKNKPFEGHGIGYHQGKTVVIQLPAAKTYKLSDVPSFYVFDYFSKAPQTVSSSVVEGFGVGQKINSQDYNTHVSTEEYPNQNTDVKKEPNGNTTEAAQYNNESSKHGQIEQVDDFSKSNSGNTDDDLDEAFERLGKIIKTHVYPSQVPDFSIYNPKDSSKKYEVIANQNQFTNINEIDTKNIKKKIDKTEYEKITDIDKEIYSASEETEEGKEDEDFAIKSGDSQIKNYSDPFLVGSNKPFITPKSFEHEIYDEAIDDIKNEYEIHLSNDQDYPASKYSLNDFKIPQTENFSEAFKAYKLNDNQSKPNYVLNYLDVANSKLERNQYQSRKPKSHEFKDFGLLVPLKIKFYKTDDLGDETYEHSKNTDFR